MGAVRRIERQEGRTIGDFRIPHDILAQHLPHLAGFQRVRHLANICGGPEHDGKGCGADQGAGYGWLLFIVRGLSITDRVLREA
jgi:hypothetical protein